MYRYRRTPVNRAPRFHGLGRRVPPPLRGDDDRIIRERSAFVRRNLFPEEEDIPMPDLEDVAEQNENPQPEESESIRRMAYKRSRTSYAPVAKTSSVNLQVARRSIILSGREFWQTITGNTTYGCQSQLLRPTDSSLFSWLAAIAKKFEEFKFLSLKFVYEPQCATSKSGTVGLFFDGDPTHVAPANWNNFINTGANVHGAVWDSHTFVVPPHLYRSRKSYYTRSEWDDINEQQLSLSNNPAFQKPTDPLEYYPGIFGVCTAECADTNAIGKVYVEYSIMLASQNVDGFNVTPITADRVLSTEVAINSGSGQYGVASAFPGVAETYLIGGAANTRPTMSWAGDDYFVRPANGYWTAKADMEVIFHSLIGAGAAITNLRLDTIRGGVTTAAVNMSGMVQDQTATLIGCREVYLLGLAGVAVNIAYSLKLDKGDQIQIHTTGNAAGLNSYKYTITPFVFRLNV